MEVLAGRLGQIQLGPVSMALVDAVGALQEVSQPSDIAFHRHELEPGERVRRRRRTSPSPAPRSCPSNSSSPAPAACHAAAHPGRIVSPAGRPTPDAHGRAVSSSCAVAQKRSYALLLSGSPRGKVGNSTPRRPSFAIRWVSRMPSSTSSVGTSPIPIRRFGLTLAEVGQKVVVGAQTGELQLQIVDREYPKAAVRDTAPAPATRRYPCP